MNKKNTLIYLLAMAIATTSCWPFGFSPSSPDPKLEIDRVQHDFGPIPPTETVQTTFKVKNVGGKTLEISRIQTSCGCTAAMMDSQSLKPGDSSRLKVTFDPRGKSGKMARTLWLFTNDKDPASQQKQIVIMADVAATSPMQQPTIQVVPSTSMPAASGTPMNPTQSIAIPQAEVRTGAPPVATPPATPAAQPAPAPAPAGKK